MSEINFIRHLISSKDVESDPSKIVVVKMPSSTNVSGVKRLCRMVQYMARFLPNLANDLEPFRKITSKGEEWNWSAECEAAIQIVKKKISTAPILKFYDHKKDSYSKLIVKMALELC